MPIYLYSGEAYSIALLSRFKYHQCLNAFIWSAFKYSIDFELATGELHIWLEFEITKNLLDAFYWASLLFKLLIIAFEFVQRKNSKFIFVLPESYLIKPLIGYTFFPKFYMSVTLSCDIKQSRFNLYFSLIFTWYI